MHQSTTSEKPNVESSSFNPLIEKAKDAPEVILENLGGIALSAVFPELTLDTDDDIPPEARTFSANGSRIRTTIPRISYHVAFPEGIVFTPSTRAAFIPPNAQDEIVAILLTASASDLQVSLSERANDLAQPFTLTPKYGTERQPGMVEPWEDAPLVNPRNDPSNAHLARDRNWVPAPTTGTISEFALLTPLAEHDPADAVMEADSQIQAISPTEDTPRIMDEARHTLAQTYYYTLKGALGIDYKENNVGSRFLQDFRPVLLSPTLVALVDRRNLDDPKAASLIVLAEGYTKAGNRWWHKKNFIPGEEDGAAINRWLHGLEKDKQYNGPHIEPLK